MKKQFKLLEKRSFLPLFITQFMGAFHDNLFKNAFVVSLIYMGVSADQGAHDSILTSWAQALFVLPFVLFSTFGGQLADKYDKSRVIRKIKTGELLIASFGAYALISQQSILCLATIFALGTYSAVFGPSKYSILPQHLQQDELINGNALLNSGTYLAILLGTIIGTSITALPGGLYVMAVLVISCAFGGLVSSRYVPAAPPCEPHLKINMNIFSESFRVVRYAFSLSRALTLSVLGISWFYFMGGMFLTQLPNFCKNTLHLSEHYLTVLLVLFSIGIGIGGLLNNRLLKGRIEGTYVPLAILGITFFSFDLFYASAEVYGYLPVRVAFDIFMISVCGGVYVVPLTALLQDRAEPSHRARMMAANAIVNSVFIVASAVVSGLMIELGFTIREIFYYFAILNAFVAVWICRLFPAYLIKSLLQSIFKLAYRVEVRGLENFDEAGRRAVIVSNHVSYLDPALLAAFLPGRPIFAVNLFVAQWWWVKPFLKMVEFFPLDPSNPYSLKGLIKKVAEDNRVVIFPEGRLSETGALMKIYDGPGMIADKTDAMILPIRLDGVQHSLFARLKGKFSVKLFPKITITILKPVAFKIDPRIKSRERRAIAGKQLHQIMEDMMFASTAYKNHTLFQRLMHVKTDSGAKTTIAEDIQFKPVTIKKLIRNSTILARVFAAQTTHKECVGVMLPNSIGLLTTFFALQACGRVPAMINFSSGLKSIQSALGGAAVKTIYTSRKFIETARLDALCEGLAVDYRIIYLEDIKKSIGFITKLLGIFVPAKFYHASFCVTPSDPAVVLFTSGSEGVPKGVVLTHVNLISNISQVQARIDFNRQDVVFNCLPMFHSFGLTGGALMPVLNGVKVFLYPSPLHYRIVPEMIYACNATIMFGTDTFLRQYAKYAHVNDFYRMRFVFAGAEKVRDETRDHYAHKFGLMIIEGYGTTETSPVIAVNSKMMRKDGSVGKILPGIDYRLEAVEGVQKGGRFYVRGPNVMAGYYKPEQPGTLVPPQDGWHDTGDIAEVDEDRYVFLCGRAKRFAKIAGEMISLAAVEEIALAVWPHGQHAVVTLSDERKGEKMVIFTTIKEADKKYLQDYVQTHGLSLLMVPSSLIFLEKLPVLGTGKTDYVMLEMWAVDATVLPEGGLLR